MLITHFGMYVCLFLLIFYLVDSRRSFKSIYGLNRYTEWQIGTLNVVLVVPHGGYYRPASLPDRRKAGCYVDNKCVYNYKCYPPDYTKCRTLTGLDLKTRELSQELAYNLEILTSHRPHVILNHLYRGKLDPNREENEATFGNNCSKRAYRDFHKFITAAKTLVDGHGLLLDIHGQSHPEGWLELGYAISRYKLNSGTFRCTYNSIETLTKRQCGQEDCKRECVVDIIQGASSLGNHIMSEIPGVTVVPSSTYPCPGSGNYFSGGYVIRRHGSKWYGGEIDGIQVESPRHVRSDRERAGYAWGLAKAIRSYLKDHYDETAIPSCYSRRLWKNGHYTH